MTPIDALNALYRDFAAGAAERRFSDEVRQTYREAADKVLGALTRLQPGKDTR